MIARISCFGLVVSLSCITSIPMEADAGERENVLIYIRKHVIGKTLEHRSTSKISEGKIETEFTRRTTFTNLVETSSGMAFDEVIIIKQVLYDLDEQGKRASPGRNQDRFIVVRHEYSVRKSTGHVLGIGRVLTNSLVDSTGAASSERISLKGNSLIIHRSALGYDDFFAPGGRFEPGTDDVQDEFSVRDGKLHRVETTTSYRVDPETLKRLGRLGEVDKLVDEESPLSKPE